MGNSVKQFWDHIKDDNLINDMSRGLKWEDLNADAQNGVKYLYYIALGVYAENNLRKAV